MNKELHYTRVEFPATEKVVGAHANPNVGVVMGLKSGEEGVESFFEALKRERPDGINWDRVDLAVAVLKGEKEAVTPKPPEPEPTESQKFWRDMYRTGKLSPYQKDRPPVEWSALIDFGKKYFGHPIEFYKNGGKDIMDLDMRLRGGADKEYNQLGDMSQRAKRMLVMAGNVVPFMTFDIVTSIPSGLMFEYLEPRMKEDKKNVPAEDRKLHPERVKNSLWGGAKKIIEVQNDKVVTALGDLWVQKFTGEKSGWIHEAADKSADLGQTASEDYLKDVINGPVLESVARFIFQIPIAGALFEQGFTRLSLLQEKSQLHKGIAKSFYMGVGTIFYILRGLKYKETDEKKAPSTRIAHKIWSRMRLVLDRNPYNFYQFVDTGKTPKWMAGQNIKTSIWVNPA